MKCLLYCLLETYTENTMKKKGVLSHANKKTDKARSQTRSQAVSKPSMVFRATKSVKRYGKRSLRAILLSHTLHRVSRVAVVVLLATIPCYGVYAYLGQTAAKEVIVSKSQILERVAKHTTLPKEEPEAVVRVEDPETLKKQNSFYEQVQEGDYIIMFRNMAIIYDLRNDELVALKHTRD